MLNKQEAKPQATELSSCKGFLFVSWVEWANEVESAKGQVPSWDF
jgi:hypothetical protein